MKNNNDFILLFEELLAEYAGSKYAIVTDSCSNALFLSMIYLSKCNKYEKVQIIPKHTYVSVPMQMIHAGFIPKFENVIWQGVYQIGNLPLYDSAQRFTKDMYIKNSLYCLSFHQKKLLKIGKGGAILTDDVNIYKYLKRACFDGRDSGKSMSEDDIATLGYHMNMTPDDAVKGILLLNQYVDKQLDNGGNNIYTDLTTYKVFQNEK